MKANHQIEIQILIALIDHLMFRFCADRVNARYKLFCL